MADPRRLFNSNKKPERQRRVFARVPDNIRESADISHIDELLKQAYDLAGTCIQDLSATDKKTEKHLMQRLKTELLYQYINKLNAIKQDPILPVIFNEDPFTGEDKPKRIYKLSDLNQFLEKTLDEFKEFFAINNNVTHAHRLQPVDARSEGEAGSVKTSKDRYTVKSSKDRVNKENFKFNLFDDASDAGSGSELDDEDIKQAITVKKRS